MTRSLLARINAPTAHLSTTRDWQVSKIYGFEQFWFAKEKRVSAEEALKIIGDLSRHWGMFVTPIFPECEMDNGGEAWAVSKRAAAINISHSHLYPSILVHEFSHGIVECTREFNEHGKKIKDPGHGALWAGVYAHNIDRILKKDIRGPLLTHNIKVADQDTIEEFRGFFKSA